MRILYPFLFLILCVANSLNATPAHVVEAKRLLEKEALHLNSYWMQEILEVGGSFLDKLTSCKMKIAEKLQLYSLA